MPICQLPHLRGSEHIFNHTSQLFQPGDALLGDPALYGAGEFDAKFPLDSLLVVTIF